MIAPRHERDRTFARHRAAGLLSRIGRMQRLNIALLGEPRIHVDDRQVPCASKKAAGLIYYLACSGGRKSRRELARLFWSGDQEAARTSLRSVLQRVPAVLAPWLSVDRESIALLRTVDASVTVDIERFADLAAAEDIESLSRASELYGGDLLKGLELDAAPEYDDWLHRERIRFRQLAQSVFDRLITRHRERAGRDSAHAASGREAAMAAARRWIDLEPAAEAAHRWLMRLFFETGQRDAALAQFEVCQRELAVALGRGPDAETRALGEAIAAGGSAGESVRPAADSTSTAFEPALRAPEIAGTSFVGRIEELATLEQLLGDPSCRLLTLHALGGVGKSRLAFALANQMASRFTLGATWISLETVATSDRLPLAIGGALGIELPQRSDPAAALVEALRGQERLLVLDNFEHLGAGGAADLLLGLLRAAPALRLVVTSREVLGLQEEWVFEVPGLAFPAAGLARTSASGEYPAVELFMQRARQAYLGFSPEAEWPHVARICNLVEGLPLAIELVSAWVRTVPCADLARAVETEMAATAARHRNRPIRQRSLDAVVRTSWQLLSREQRRALEPLSAFASSFSHEAAQAVAGASLRILSALVDKALVVRRPDGRCSMHELVRQFLRAQLAPRASAMREAERRFAGHFAAQLVRLRGLLDGPEELTAELTISLELPNLMVAGALWRDARGELVERTAEPMLRVLMGRGLSREAVTMATHLLGRSALSPATRTLVLAYRGRALSMLGEAVASATDFDAAIALGGEHRLRHPLAFASLYAMSAGQFGEESEAVLHRLAGIEPLLAELADPALTMRARYFAGVVLDAAGRPLESERSMREALAMAEIAGAPTFLATIRSGMALPILRQGRLEEAESLLRESLSLFERIGIAQNVARVLNSLALVTLWRAGSSGAAEAAGLAQRALVLFKRIGHPPGQAAALDSLGQARAALGQHRDAQADFERAAAIGSPLTASEARFHLGLLQLDVGRADLATALALQLVETAETQGLDPVERIAALLTAAIALRADPGSPDASAWLRGLLDEPDLDFELRRKAEALLALAPPALASGGAAESPRLAELRAFLGSRTG